MLVHYLKPRESLEDHWLFSVDIDDLDNVWLRVRLEFLLPFHLYLFRLPGSFFLLHFYFTCLIVRELGPGMLTKSTCSS